MALVKYGGGITQMSGSLAGNTFARNRYGNYVRSRTHPINPNTALQTIVRAALAELTARWSQTLTAAQRTAWNLYGANVVMLNKLGENINLTGFNHYIRSNTVRLRVGAPVADAGPVIFELPAADPAFAVSLSEATQQVTLTYDPTMDWADEDNAYMLFAQGQPQNAQRNFFAGPWRHISQVEGVDGAPPASPKISAAVFAVAEGQRVWARARISRADGRLSQPFRSNAFVAA